MAITPKPQQIIVAGRAFVVALTSDGLIETGHMRVLVGEEERNFRLTPEQAPAEEQLVTVLGGNTVSVQEGWGSPNDEDSELVVEVDDRASEPVVIRGANS